MAAKEESKARDRTEGDEEDRYITDAQLAKMLQWNESTPCQLRKRGKMPIPYVKIGKRTVRYKLSKVHEYMAQNTVHPPNPN
jgi:predicted DNA-binding transcriptional regulator AlpA